MDNFAPNVDNRSRAKRLWITGHVIHMTLRVIHNERVIHNATCENGLRTLSTYPPDLIMSITDAVTSTNRHSNNAPTEPILKASSSRYNDFQFKKYPFHGFFPVKAGFYEG